MTDPINKIIFDTVDARLKLVKTANGYPVEFKDSSVKRAMVKPFKGYDLPACNYWASNVQNETDRYGIDKRTLNLFIEIQSKTHDIPFVDVADVLAQVMLTALNRDPSAPQPTDEKSHDLGGIVDDFRFLGYDYQVGTGQEPFCAIMAQFEVEYSTDLNNI